MACDIIDERLLGALHLRALRRSGLDHDPRAEHVAFQTGTLDALMAGRYDGDTTVAALLEHGDLGIGTVQHLGGELVVLDGAAWVAHADRSVECVNPATATPFAVVCRFEPQVVEELVGPLGLDQLRSRIDELSDAGTAGRPSVLAVRLEGRFARVRLRSVDAQTPPYPPLVEVTERQQEWTVRDLDATIVGFRFPDASAGVEVPGYHLHLLSSDRCHGGHVLDLELDAGVVALDGGDELHVVVPEGTALGPSGFVDRDAIRRVEGG